MKHQETWQETKFSLKRGQLCLNKQHAEIHPGSWIVGECVARLYGKYLPNFATGDLLDLGCGMCPLYGYYRQFATSVFCVDWENSFHPNPYTDLSCDISQPIPLPGGLFDTIILSDVLEHLPHPESCLQEVYRLLKPNGTVILNVPFLYWLHETPYDFYRYTEYALSQFLKGVNFKIEVLEVVGGALESWADLTAKIAIYFPLVHHCVPQSLYQIVFGLRRLTAFNKKFINLDRLFPTGYFVVARRP